MRGGYSELDLTSRRSIAHEVNAQMPTTLTSKAMSVSWIPPGAVIGLPRAVFDVGIARYDPPPPKRLDDLEQLKANNALRFANVLEGWAEVADNHVVRAGYTDGAMLVMGSTTLRFGPREANYAGVALPVLQNGPEYRDDGSVRLVQTCGGRAATPAPRAVPHPPFIKVQAPCVWTTLALTIRPNGESAVELVDASLFPQHWVYDGAGRLTIESDPPAYSTWLAHSFGPRTPWAESRSERAARPDS